MKTTHQYRFPYNYSVSSPVITNWRWVYPPDEFGNSDWINIPSNVAWALGSNQVFDYLKFSVYNGSTFIENDNIGENSFWVAQNPINSINGWSAMYYVSQPDPNNSDYWLYTIVFF